MWQRNSAKWNVLPLSDTGGFNPQCVYVLNGMSVAYVDTTQIIANVAAITSTTYTVAAGSKSLVHLVQYNWSNALDYGYLATSSIAYSCP